LTTAPTFFVVSGTAVKEITDRQKQRIFDTVEAAYRLHDAGHTINPDSYFLRYPKRPNSRIIALPAHVGGDFQKSGIKWISSFPDNTANNLARASAVLILNDAKTGYPLACLEASLISSTRTAASAALAAEHLAPEPFTGTLGVIGTGVIARATVEWLLFRGWSFEKVSLFDLNREDAEQFGAWLAAEHGVIADIRDTLEETISSSSLVVFATTAGQPYLHDERIFKHSPTVLHLSLRDIGEDIILESQNIVDDIDHCLKAGTSLHLTETETGNRDFVSGTLADVLNGKVRSDPSRTRIFSPFGLGVLDIAVGHLVFEMAKTTGSASQVPDFFSNSVRW
jgi:2,3-diaminopropionate biosynthesis protein SbnB